MNPDFRVHVDFFDHFKAIKLQKQLGPEGVIALMRLWAWTAKNRPNGVLSGMDGVDVEIAARWSGKQGAFNDVTTALRLLDFADGAYRLHDWKDYNEWQAEAQNRSDSSRLARMAKIYPEIYKKLEQAGIKGLSREVYNAITSSKDSLTTVERLLTNASSPFLSSPCLSSPYYAEEERESSLRSDSLSGPSIPDVTAGSPSEAAQEGTLRKKQAKKHPTEFPENSEAYQLAVVMRNTLKANVPTLKEPDLQKWARCFDVAMRNDDRMKNASFVAQVIAWACSDSFWRANIQSPGKLREKFDQLTAKMETEAAKKRNSPQSMPWKSPAQRRFEANQQAGREAKRLLFGEQEVREYQQ